MVDAEMLADASAYDAAKARLENGEDELIPLEIIEARAQGRGRAPHLAGVSEAYPGAACEEGKGITRPYRGH